MEHSKRRLHKYVTVEVDDEKYPLRLVPTTNRRIGTYYASYDIVLGQSLMAKISKPAMYCLWHLNPMAAGLTARVSRRFLNDVLTDMVRSL
jgi:hypothetical protein